MIERNAEGFFYSFIPSRYLCDESNTQGFFYSFIPSENLNGDREQHRELLLQLHPLLQFVWRSRATPRASSTASSSPRICVVIESNAEGFSTTSSPWRRHGAWGRLVSDVVPSPADRGCRPGQSGVKSSRRWRQPTPPSFRHESQHVFPMLLLLSGIHWLLKLGTFSLLLHLKPLC